MEKSKNNNEVKINQEQRLFVIPCGEGFSCLGFDNLWSKVKTLCAMLEPHCKDPAGTARMLLQAALVSEVGSMVQYKYYLELLTLAGRFNLGTFYDEKTPGKVRRILESARSSDQTLRVFYGDPDSGQDWMEESDVIFKVGRSTGVIKSPLAIIEDENSFGGCPILDGNIVRIIDTSTGGELYRHKNYHFKGELSINPISCESMIQMGYKFSVKIGESIAANFAKIEEASHFVAFLTGKSFVKLNC